MRRFHAYGTPALSYGFQKFIPGLIFGQIPDHDANISLKKRSWGLVISFMAVGLPEDDSHTSCRYEVSPKR